jgi:hypothetical protein
MKLLTEDATLVCNHVTGTVDVPPSEDLVFVEGRRLLVEDDPEGRPIAGCPIQPPLKPCTNTLGVQEGYSGLVRIAGWPVCLDTLTGRTDGTPPGEVHYRVLQPGQDWVSEGE